MTDTGAKRSAGALARSGTSFGYLTGCNGASGMLATYLRNRMADNALHEVQALTRYRTDDGDTLEALPPLIRAGQFEEALVLIEREASRRSIHDVCKAYAAAPKCRATEDSAS